MREGLGAIIALMGMVLFAASIATLIRPMKAIRLGTRKRAGLALVGSIALFTLGGFIMPPPTPEERAATERATAERAAQREKREQERAAKDAADQKAASEQAAAEAERQKPIITAAAKSLWTEVTTQVSSCDTAGNNVADYMGRRGASIYEAYPMVQEAEDLCSTAATNVGRIDVPDAIPASGRGKFKEAIETCRNAYYAKSSAFGQMATVLNGDVRPSAVTDARNAAERSEAGTMLCGLGFLQAINDSGLDIAEVMGKDFAENN